MEYNFNKAADYVLLKEGGYANRPVREDPGGPTKYGITLKTLEHWRKRKLNSDHVKNLTWGEAKDIYKRDYWDTIRGDDLPAGLDYVTFDFSIHSYYIRAAKNLQRIVGSTPDGKIGNKTLDSIYRYIENKSLEELIDIYLDDRLNFLSRLDNWKYNKNGWINRINFVRNQYKDFI